MNLAEQQDTKSILRRKMRKLEQVSVFQLAGGNPVGHEIRLDGCNKHVKKKREGREGKVRKM